jgi:pimeloyl-ACP methyl ester carboxylesterase
MKNIPLVFTILFVVTMGWSQLISIASPQQPTTVVMEPPTEDTAAHLARLGAEPCPDSNFTCISVEVPYDHFNPDGRTLDVVFGVLPASGERKGMFVSATGGPGTSGLQAAEGYTAAFDPSIPEHFDIVFFNQRGVGLSGGLQCVNAAAVFYRSEWEAFTPEQEITLLETARTFTERCVAEMGNPDFLIYLGTQYAVEDLEVFRATMGDESFWLYGESYSTQFAQTCAAAHPDRLAGLILDGTVDLTLDSFDFHVQQAQAFNDVMVMTPEACDMDDLCAADMSEDAVMIMTSRQRNSTKNLWLSLISYPRVTRRLALSLSQKRFLPSPTIHFPKAS